MGEGEGEGVCFSETKLVVEWWFDGLTTNV
jgi:hypothetical protein